MKLLLVSLVIVGLALSATEATVLYTVEFDDPGAAFAPFYPSITRSVLAAGQGWSQYLAGVGTIDVVVDFSPFFPTAAASSMTFPPVGTIGGLQVFEQGAASEIRTGVDPNGAAPDARIIIGTNYLTNELFFGSGQVPVDKTEARSVFLHEFGHIFAFNGVLNPFTGEAFGFASTFDRHVRFDGANLFFTGPSATAVYGDNVPLTFGNYPHVGNSSPPGTDLVGDLMSGVSFDRGRAYEISSLDLAILIDAGVPVPQPAILLLMGSGLTGLVFVGWRRRR